MHTVHVHCTCTYYMHYAHRTHTCTLYMYAVYVFVIQHYFGHAIDQQKHSTIHLSQSQQVYIHGAHMHSVSQTIHSPVQV